MGEDEKKYHFSKALAKIRRAVWKFCVEEKYALLIFFAVTLLKLFIEEWQPMEWMRGQAFVALHHYLMVEPRRQIPVVLVDISHLIQVRPGESAGEVATNHFSSMEDYYSPTDLSNIVYRVARQHPAAIGIDIDFSPDFDLSLEAPRSKYLFLDYCSHAQAASGSPVPVFAGVYRGAAYSPRYWLGDESLTNLAAWIAIYEGSPIFRVPARLHNYSDATDLRSMGLALAESYKARGGGPESRLASRLRRLFASDYEVEDFAIGTNRLERWSYYVNFNYLPRLLNERGTKIPAEDILRFGGPGMAGKTDLELQELLKDKIVLIGDAEAHHNDDVSVPGESRPTAGVYVHACGVCTLIDRPLASMRWGIGAALALLVLVFFLCLKRRNLLSENRFHILLPYTAALSVAAIAWFFAISTHILWLDSISVVAALFFERDFHLLLDAKHGHAQKKDKA